MLEMFDPRTMAFLLTLLMAGLAVLLRIRSGSWSNPSVIFALFWFAMAFFPVLGVPEIVPSPLAIAYIGATVLAFGIPVFFMQWRPALAAAELRRGTTSAIFGGNQFLMIFLLLQLVPLLSIVANIAFQGFSVRTIFTDPFSLGCEYLGYRYSGRAKPFVGAQIGTVVNYVTAPIAGLIVANRRNYLISALVVLMCMLPSLFNIAVYADKGTVFLTMALFYGGVIVGRTMNGNTALLTWRSVASAPLVLVVIGTVIAFALINRSSATCEERTTIIAEKFSTVVSSAAGALTSGGATTVQQHQQQAKKEMEEEAGGLDSGMKYNLRSYAFGHLFAFSAWFDHWVGPRPKLSVDNILDGNWLDTWTMNAGKQVYTDPEKPTYGFWTFMAVGKFFDRSYYASLPDGYFQEYFLRTGVLQTNIHTFYRGLIYDFGLIGSCVFMLILGFVTNLAYRTILLFKWAPISSGIIVWYAGFLYTSYIISLMIWSTVYASILAFILFMFVVRRLEHGNFSIGEVLIRPHLLLSGSRG